MKKSTVTVRREKQLIVAITARDIANGRRRSSDSCPLALSLKRRYPDAAIDVTYDAVMVGDRELSLPGQAALFMGAFDAGRPVKPTMLFFDAPV